MENYREALELYNKMSQRQRSSVMRNSPWAMAALSIGMSCNVAFPIFAIGMGQLVGMHLGHSVAITFFAFVLTLVITSYANAATLRWCIIRDIASHLRIRGLPDEV